MISPTLGAWPRLKFVAVSSTYTVVGVHDGQGHVVAGPAGIGVGDAEVDAADGDGRAFGIAGEGPDHRIADRTSSLLIRTNGVPFGGTKPEARVAVSVAPPRLTLPVTITWS